MRRHNWMAACLAGAMVLTVSPVVAQAAETPPLTGMKEYVKRILEDYQKEADTGLYYGLYSMTDVIEELPDRQVTFDLIDPQSGKVTPGATGSFKAYWKQLNQDYAQAVSDDMLLDDRTEGLRVSRFQWGQYRLLDAYDAQYHGQLTEKQMGILNGSRALLLYVEMRQANARLIDLNVYVDTRKQEGQGLADIAAWDYGRANQLFDRALAELQQGKVEETFDWLYRSVESSYRVMRVYGIDYSKKSFEQDTDGDRMPDLLELYFKTNFLRQDTDGDGLSDAFEHGSLDPTKRDSYGYGTEDGLYDNDQDGLNNLEEQQAGTAPDKWDTDDDHLSDGDEVHKYKTDPRLYDTDNDQVSDGKEIEIGTDPLKFDTDGDGKSDYFTKVKESVELYEQELEMFTEAGVIPEIVVEGRPGAGALSFVSDAYYYNSMTDSIPAMIGHPLDFMPPDNFDKVTITLHITDKAGPVEMNGLRVARYDLEKKRMAILPKPTIDETNHTVSIDVTQKGIYVLIQFE